MSILKADRQRLFIVLLNVLVVLLQMYANHLQRMNSQSIEAIEYNVKSVNREVNALCPR